MSPAPEPCGPPTWIPGEGPSAPALARMRAHFPRPASAPREAWFMGERQAFHAGLLEAAPSTRELERFLFDAAAGTSAFGPRAEWSAWFQHLLPHLVERGHELHAFHPLAEVTVTAFFHFFPGELAAYPGFRDDVLATLGRGPMAPALWDEAGRYARRPTVDRAGVRLDGALSAALVFGLHHLTAAEIPPWIASACAIGDTTWRLQLLGWLAGAVDLLAAEAPEPARLAEASPRLDWNASSLLAALVEGRRAAGDAYDLWPAPNRRACLAAFREAFPAPTLREALAALAHAADADVLAALAPALARLPARLHGDVAAAGSGAAPP